jgi:hypothetical protein
MSHEALSPRQFGQPKTYDFSKPYKGTKTYAPPPPKVEVDPEIVAFLRRRKKT